MVKFEAIIKKFKSQGEKTGWSYVEVLPEIIEAIKGPYKKSFRVKGTVDNLRISQLALVPMGQGTFIMPLKGSIRKEIKKTTGDKVKMQLEEDKDEISLNKNFLSCLQEEPEAKKYFESLPKGHQNYFNNWINSAKTDPTIAKRIGMALNALTHKQDFGTMIRSNKNSEKKIYESNF